jgi:hypothetical protein
MRPAFSRTPVFRQVILMVLTLAAFTALGGLPQRAAAAMLPAIAAQSADRPASGGLIQDVRYYHRAYHRRAYYHRPVYRRAYYRRPVYRGYYGYRRPYYRPVVVCRVRYGYWGPHRVCYRR